MIIKEIKKQAEIYNADEYLAIAICIVENLQRPSWFRILERIKSFFIPQGTYGIMQVSSNGYISDEESIHIAMRDYLLDTSGKSDMIDVIKRYNADDRYMEMVLEFYRAISPLGR